MSDKNNKISTSTDQRKKNKFTVEAAKEVGVDLENFNNKKLDSKENEPVDESMYVRIVRSFKKF